MFCRTPLPEDCHKCSDGDGCDEIQGTAFKECHDHVNSAHFFKACQQDARTIGEVSKICKR